MNAKHACRIITTACHQYLDKHTHTHAGHGVMKRDGNVTEHTTEPIHLAAKAEKGEAIFSVNLSVYVW